MRLSGEGETTATALVAMIGNGNGNGHDLANGRPLIVWLGLVPGSAAPA